MTSDNTTDNATDSPSLWRRLRDRRSTRWAIDIAIVVVLVLAISAFQSRHLLDADDPLPPVTIEALDGSTLALDELEARRTIVYFWTTWCSICDVQSGPVAAMHDRAEDNDDLDVVSIVLHYDNRRQIEKFVDEEEIDYPVYLGTDATARAFEVNSFPTIYIVDDTGQVRHGLVGYTTRFGMWARLWI